MSTTLVVAVGAVGVLFLLIGLGWRIGRLGERVRQERRTYHRERNGAEAGQSSRTNHVIILLGKHVKLTNHT